MERDEDIELKLGGEHLYLQIKTRSRDLAKSDIEAALERYSTIRTQHASGSRLGSPKFYVISDAEPNGPLSEDIESWPSDVSLITQNSTAVRPDCLPPAWRTIEEALEWCRALAATIPFIAISAETLIWKLAAIVQHASAGVGVRREHEFLSSELPSLFEQIVRLNSTNCRTRRSLIEPKKGNRH